MGVFSWIPKWGLVPQGQWHLLEPPVIWGREDTPQPCECQGCITDPSAYADWGIVGPVTLAIAVLVKVMVPKIRDILWASKCPMCRPIRLALCVTLCGFSLLGSGSLSLSLGCLFPLLGLGPLGLPR